MATCVPSKVTADVGSFALHVDDASPAPVRRASRGERAVRLLLVALLLLLVAAVATLGGVLAASRRRQATLRDQVAALQTTQAAQHMAVGHGSSGSPGPATFA